MLSILASIKKDHDKLNYVSKLVCANLNSELEIRAVFVRIGKKLFSFSFRLQDTRSYIGQQLFD